MASAGLRMAVALRDAVGDFRAGRLVLLIDDREDRGYLVAAAATASTETLVYLSTYGRGAVTVTLADARLRELGLAPLERGARAEREYCMPVDVAGRGGPLGHAGMAATVRALADPATTAADLVVPGHIFPLRTDPEGPLGPIGLPQAAIELARLAGCGPAVVICDACDEQGGPADAFAAQRLAGRISRRTATVSQLDLERERRDPGIVRAVGVGLPTLGGPLEVTAFTNRRSGREYYVFARGAVGRGPVDVHVHVQCRAGDVFGGGCGCREELGDAVAAVHRRGRGMVVYVPADGPAGMRHLTDGPAAPPNPADLAGVLRESGVTAVRLCCNEPLDPASMVGFGVELAAAGSLPTARAAVG